MPFSCPPQPNSRSLVLVADDEPVVRDIVRCMAETSGYDVLLATDAGEALGLAERFRGQLEAVLLDWHMPGMDDGTLQRMRDLSPSTRLLIMTGDETCTQSLRAVDDILLKPFSMSELDSALSHSLLGVL